MHQAHYPEILAFVEGAMEKIFINRNFNYVRVVSIDNGSGWTVDMMADQIENKYLILDRNPDFVVVWFDREDRPESSEEISILIRHRLKKIGIVDARIKICIADRCTENIILADEPLISKEMEIPDYSYPGDGVNGKSIMKKLFKSKNGTYKETFHGTNLLKQMRVSNSATNSKSAQNFHQNFNVLCWWF